MGLGRTRDYTAYAPLAVDCLNAFEEFETVALDTHSDNRACKFLPLVEFPSQYVTETVLSGSIVVVKMVPSTDLEQGVLHRKADTTLHTAIAYAHRHPFNSDG